MRVIEDVSASSSDSESVSDEDEEVIFTQHERNREWGQFGWGRWGDNSKSPKKPTDSGGCGLILGDCNTAILKKPLKRGNV